MISPVNQSTTVVDVMPKVFLPVVQNPSYNLYFHIILKINNKSLNTEDRRKLERYIVGFVRTKCDIKVIGTTAKQLNLLIAMPQTYLLVNLVNEIKLLSKNFVRRKLNTPKFDWHEDYDTFTVSLSQISRVRANIWRQMQFEG